jgi:hypothetical protein
MRTAYINISDGTHKANLYLTHGWFPGASYWRCPPGYVGNVGSGTWEYHGTTVDVLESALPGRRRQVPWPVLTLHGVSSTRYSANPWFPFQVGQTGPGTHFVMGKLISPSLIVMPGSGMMLPIPGVRWRVLAVT